MDKENALAFEDIRVNVKFRLFALWSSVMFFYIYGDYFQLYQPGQLQDMIAGKTVVGAISQTFLLGISAVMIIPSLMPFLSLALPAGVNRWVNIVSGTLYTVIMILAIRVVGISTFLRIDRNRTDRTCRLVRVDLAEASGARGNRVIVDMSAHFLPATNS